MKIAEMQNFKFYSKTEKKYYFIYCRKSQESEDRQVQSIEDQLASAKQIAFLRNLQILKPFTESQSAKQPGRPVFNEMIETIYKRHDIRGIIVWKFNRLSRNPVDEGIIRWLLRSGEIEEIVTPNKIYTQEDSDYVMATEGAGAQRFISDLSSDTKRGLKSKIDRGIFPGLASVGYFNDVSKPQGQRDILPHLTYFSLMKKIFEHALTGNYSIETLHRMVVKLKIRNSRGNIISRTQLYECLRNPFYTGKYYRYGGKLYDNGIHKPMITIEQFDLLQDILDGRSNPRKVRHEDLLTGVFTCGKSGHMITGEHHVKKYKNGKIQTFTYYKCTDKRGLNKCTQPYISGKELVEQINTYLKSLQISRKYIDWAVKWLNEENVEQKKAREDYYNSLSLSYKTIVTKLNSLLDLKLSPANFSGQLISEEEFITKRLELTGERDAIHKQLDSFNQKLDEWITFASKTFDFATQAEVKFNKGTIEEKKTILKAIGSNLVLNDKKVYIKLRTPFLLIKKAKPAIDELLRIEPKEMLLNQAESNNALENFDFGWYNGLEPSTLRSTT